MVALTVTAGLLVAPAMNPAPAAGLVPSVASEGQAATGEPPFVDSQPLGDLPVEKDPAAAIDALPREKRAIPT